jgi:hypothetical protein
VLAVVSSADEYLLPKLAKAVFDYLKARVLVQLKTDRAGLKQLTIDLVAGARAADACEPLEEMRDSVIEGVLDLTQRKKEFTPTVQELMAKHPSFGTEVLKKVSDLLTNIDAKP